MLAISSLIILFVFARCRCSIFFIAFLRYLMLPAAISQLTPDWYCNMRLPLPEAACPPAFMLPRCFRLSARDISQLMASLKLFAQYARRASFFSRCWHGRFMSPCCHASWLRRLFVSFRAAGWLLIFRQPLYADASASQPMLRYLFLLRSFDLFRCCFASLLLLLFACYRLALRLRSFSFADADALSLSMPVDIFPAALLAYMLAILLVFCFRYDYFIAACFAASPIFFRFFFWLFHCLISLFCHASAGFVTFDYFAATSLLLLSDIELPSFSLYFRFSVFCRQPPMRVTFSAMMIRQLISMMLRDADSSFFRLRQLAARQPGSMPSSFLRHCFLRFREDVRHFFAFLFTDCRCCAFAFQII